MDFARAHVLVCGGTGCTSSGSAVIIDEFEKSLKENGLDKEVKVIKTGCFGLCALGPVVVVYPEGSFYSMVKPEDVEEIVKDIKNQISKERVTEQPQMESDSASRAKIEDYVEEQDGRTETSVESPNESMEEDEYIEDEDSSVTQLEYYLISVDSSPEKDSLFSFDLMTNFAGISYCHIMAEDGT